MVKVAINGFGRIGRIAFRVWLSRPDLQEKLTIVAVNTSGSMAVAGWAHLLKYDTAYGKLDQEIHVEELKKPDEVSATDAIMGYLTTTGWRVPILAQREPSKLPWKDYGIDVVIEATGKFTSEEAASQHLTAGAKRVLISAPSKGGNIGTYVLGVNRYVGEQSIADNASCTTNCIAPVVAVIQAKLGILKAGMTTVHAYTDDQRVQDNSHEDLRRARAAGANIIPTSTGAATATTKTIPELKGLFDGVALRVPVITGSISDVTCLSKRQTSVEEVNQIFREAAQGEQWKGILAVTDEPLVSSDIIGRSESAIVDLSLTQVIGGDLIKVFAWYDNEWGYANRLMEQAIVLGTSD
ncbi:type I glyceraldehyde-3-phosphate dehydrogenase [Microgenomates group bacterium RIFCSPHIGHO2_01_FULL_45_11]|nr:MAG: type I glyceraldehyde-3-phosphate dehydrogenase [Microgenomates group bacterium RIFCSPHIGHO2_01_FULL_45_11]